MEARPLYTPYDLQVPIHSHISHPPEPTSSAVSTASTCYTNEAEVAAMTPKYNVLPGSSAPSMRFRLECKMSGNFCARGGLTKTEGEESVPISLWLLQH